MEMTQFHSYFTIKKIKNVCMDTLTYLLCYFYIYKAFPQKLLVTTSFHS